MDEKELAEQRKKNDEINARRRERVRKRAGLVAGEGPNDPKNHLAELAPSFEALRVPARDFSPQHNYTEGMWNLINDHFKKGEIPIAVEIGSRRGAWSQGLLQNTKVEHLFCVDPWPGRMGHGNLSAWLRRNPPGDIFKRVHPLIAPSSFVAAWFPYKVDLLFIDGLHDADSVETDLKAWVPFVKSGGLVLGHDYNQDGVREAVDAFFLPLLSGHAKMGPQHAVTFWKVL